MPSTSCSMRRSRLRARLMAASIGLRVRVRMEPRLRLRRTGLLRFRPHSWASGGIWQTRRLQVPVSFGSWGFKSPLAHAVSYIYSPPRRRRRGVWLLAVLSVAVLIVVLVTSLRSERRVLAGYIDTVQESAAAAASSATEFVDLTDRLGEVDRQEFITTMARIRTTTGEAGTLLESADVPTDALASPCPHPIGSQQLVPRPRPCRRRRPVGRRRPGGRHAGPTHDPGRR